MSARCVVCHDQPGPVCSTDQHLIDEQLAALPRRLATLAGAPLPGQAASGERVAVSSHVATPVPGGVARMSLLGPGGQVPVVLHPLVRHWSAKRKVLVTTHVVGHARQVQVEVTDWFHELVRDEDGNPVMVPDDDQTGVVPPREWLDMQVRRWRAHFGHQVPHRTLLPRHSTRAYVPPSYVTLLRVPDGPRLVGFLAAAHVASGAQARMAYSGLLTDSTPADVAADAERRPGVAPPAESMRWDTKYLRTWLAKACAEDALDMAEFAAQLRALHAEIGRCLGDTPDQEWIGRCPAFIAELGDDGEPTGRKVPCGGGLWQDNNAFTAQVKCPRCCMTWDTRGHAGAGTAREIRRVWPVDRRRRYSAPEIDRLVTPKCRGCGSRVKIEWRDVTGTRDRQRTWQPVSARCGNSCDEARRTL